MGRSCHKTDISHCLLQQKQKLFTNLSFKVKSQVTNSSDPSRVLIKVKDPHADTVQSFSMGSRDGIVMRALASHQCGTGSESDNIMNKFCRSRRVLSTKPEGRGG